MRTRIGQRVKDGLTRGERERPGFLALCAACGITEPVTEWRFALPERRWAFDYAWPESRVALEVEGATWVSGAHNSAEGILADMEKYNRAAELNWIVVKCVPGEKDVVRYNRNAAGERTTVRFTAPALLGLLTVNIVKRVLEARKNPPPLYGAQQRSMAL